MNEPIESMADVVRLRITFLTAKNILGKFLAYVRLTRKPQHDPNFFQAHVGLARG